MVSRDERIHTELGHTLDFHCKVHARNSPQLYNGQRTSVFCAFPRLFTEGLCLESELQPLQPRAWIMPLPTKYEARNPTAEASAGGGSKGSSKAGDGRPAGSSAAATASDPPWKNHTSGAFSGKAKKEYLKYKREQKREAGAEEDATAEARRDEEADSKVCAALTMIDLAASESCHAVRP